MKRLGVLVVLGVVTIAPLHAAAEHGNAALAQALLDAGADPAAATDDGTTVVALAEGSGDADTIGMVRGALGA